MVGGNLKFFDDPERMLLRTVDLLNENGLILATPYFDMHVIPEKIKLDLHQTIGLPLSVFQNSSYKENMKMYNKFEIMFEERNVLTSESDEEIEYYCNSVISRAAEMNRIVDPDVIEIMFNRLFKIRKTINKIRPYQGYSVLVLRYRKAVYPNRYVALF